MDVVGEDDGEVLAHQSRFNCGITGGRCINSNQHYKCFQKRAEKTGGLFADINMVALSLQTRLYKLCLVCHDLDELLTECREGHTNTNSNWHGRKLPGTYINPDSDKLPNPHFVSGVIKIQLNQLLQLTPEEKPACIRLINDHEDKH